MFFDSIKIAGLSCLTQHNFVSELKSNLAQLCTYYMVISV